MLVFCACERHATQAGTWWTNRTKQCVVASGQFGYWQDIPTSHRNRHTSTLSHSSSAPSLSIAQQSGQMAAPRPTLPGKACELKVIPSRSEEMPTSSWSRRGEPQPTCLPGSRTSGRGFVEWWACCRQPLLLPSQPHCAGRRRQRLLSFSTHKWTNEQVSVCLLFSVCLDECLYVWVFFHFGK